MKTTFVFAAAACLVFAGSTRAVVYTETGDAGDLPASAQIVSGTAGTPLTSLTGALTLTNQTSDSDMFQIYVSSPSTFSASLTGFVPGSNNFDSQLMIFNAAGRGIQADDDDPTSGSSSANLPSGGSLMSAQPAGLYYLLVSGSGRYAISGTSLIFPNYTDGTTDPTLVYGPGAGTGAITGYTGSSNEGGNYSIALNGAQFIPAVAPEPSSVLLMLAAAAGLAVVARRRSLPLLAVVLAAAAPAVHAKMPDNLALGLQELATDYRAARPEGSKTLTHAQVAPLADSYPLARFDEQDRVQVEVNLNGALSMKQAIAAFEAQGCEITAKVPWFHQGMVSMWMPLNNAAKVARIAGVDSVRLSSKPHHRAGKVPGTGARVLKADLAGNSGYLGAGITVGAMSDSYNKVGTGSPVKAPADVSSGDLPGTTNPEGYLTPVNVVKDASGVIVTLGEVADEGRAMLQIIHDVAPAAGEAFYTGDISETDFATGIGTLAAAGCKVICDDIGYYDEPIFSDGVLAQAIDNATNNYGVSYFSSSGNDGNSGYRGTFTPVNNDTTAQALLLSEGGITYSGITATETAVISKFHSFGTNPDGTPILVQKVYVPKTNSSSYNATVVFQWDDPDGVTVGGVKQITTDYDILCFSVANGTATYVAGRSGTKSNFSTNLPIEQPGSALTAGTQYEFVIVLTNRTANTGGPTRDQATHLAWVAETDASQIIADFVDPKSIETHGHPCAATCAGTAAYIYDDQFSAGNVATANYTPIVEAYSSNGPAVIYFDAAGNRLANPVTRKQPLLSTVDGVSTTFFPPEANLTPSPTTPSANDTDGDSYPNFFGTSAAAPHAAGCAALILSAANSKGISLSPADVKSLMTSTTQGQSDQDPTIANATAGTTAFSARDRGTYADPQAYTMTYNGAAGTTLATLQFDLSPLPGAFNTATYAVTTGAATPGTAGATAPSITASTVTAADGVSAGTSTLNLTLANFTPGSTLSFGVAQTVTVTGGNYYIHGDQLAGAKVTSTTSAGVSATGTLANTFSRKWNYKTGYGLVDVNAAITRLLTAVPQ